MAPSCTCRTAARRSSAGRPAGRIGKLVGETGWVPSRLIVVGGSERERVAIRVLGRMHPGATDYWDGNWLLSPIEVAVGGFVGRAQAGLRTEELRSFREGLEKLYKTLEGEARLDSMEEWLSLDCRGDGLGHVEVRGSVRDEPGVGNELTFRLSLDQTFLPPIITSLSGVEAVYPVLGRP